MTASGAGPFLFGTRGKLEGLSHAFLHRARNPNRVAEYCDDTFPIINGSI